MAGTVLERELKLPRALRTRAEFTVAGESDEADIRSLLRENPMAGRISVSLEREPNYFADARAGCETKVTIVAREGGRLICAGSCAVRKRFVNGRARRVGYLGGLRLDNQNAGRFDVVRRGYNFFRELQIDVPADFYFTSIAADNHRARRFLERGLPGMPTYEFIGEFVTLLISTRIGRRSALAESLAFDRECCTPRAAGELMDFLNEQNRAGQFAPCWGQEETSARELLGLRTEDFLGLRENGRLVACGALWDQRSFKQTVIRGYTPWLGILRPAVNAAAKITSRPQLPGKGKILANAFVSHFAARPGRGDALTALIREFCVMPNRHGIQMLTLGFGAGDPQSQVVRENFRGREYRSRLYVVRWPGIGGSVRELDGRYLAPEVALL